MSEEDLEVLITLDDLGEDSLEEDTFHQVDNTGAQRPDEPQQGGATTSEQES